MLQEELRKVFADHYSKCESLLEAVGAERVTRQALTIATAERWFLHYRTSATFQDLPARMYRTFFALNLARIPELTEADNINLIKHAVVSRVLGLTKDQYAEQLSKRLLEP
jgi:hypothetical protein